MKKLTVLVVVLIVLAVGLFIWWSNGLSAVDPKSLQHKIFIIKPGTEVREIGFSLKKEGLIRDPVIFFLYVKRRGLDKSIQAGDFRLSPSMNLAKIINELQHGSLDVWVTVPEGWRAEEIADILQKDLPSYDPSWRSSLDSHEGYLFPDTYLIPRDAQISTIISLMTDTFYAKVKDIGLTRTSSNLDRVVIIASLIERESRNDSEKRTVSSVIYNRLEEGMPLQIDATVQYALGKRGDKWWTQPSALDLKINSSYNTYINIGLPPSPISNPGIAALAAALNPAKSTYLYYIHDNQGQVHFAKTLDEHNANVSKYLK